MRGSLKSTSSTIGLLFLTAACASMPSETVERKGLFDSEGTTTAATEAQGPASEPVSRPKSWKVGGIEIQNKDFDFPIANNTYVEYWIEYFTGRGRRHFRTYLKRSEYFVPYLKKLLTENQMPRDLVYLAMIESGFNNHARSRAAAVGPWQFISATGKRYGLKVNWWVDERRDVKKSTEAAIRYLRDLYTLFGSWELAAAAYNAGENKIIRAMERFGTQNFWTLARGRYLKSETRNYVPKIMAAAIVAKNRTQFGFEESYLTEEERKILDSIPKDDASQDAALSNMLREYEKETEERRRKPAELVAARFEVRDEIRSSLSHPVPYVSKKGEAYKEHLVEVEVEGPADLFKVADAAGIEYERIKKMNPEILRWCTPPREKSYRLKIPKASKDRFLSTYNDPEFPREIQFQIYRVRRGDTLIRIARRFGIRVAPLKDLNGIRSARSGLVAGKKIKIPLPADRKASYALLDIRKKNFKKRVKLRKRFKKVSLQQRKAARNGRKDGNI